MKLIEFRYVTKNDPYDPTYPHWSRKWEYPTVLSEIKKRLPEFKSTPLIHNSSWGFDQEHHSKFKNLLEKEFFAHTITNSDIVFTGVPNSCYHDITLPPNENFKEAFDIVLNVSALEEIAGDHDQYIKNLFDQVRPGGYLICTFDYPGLRSSIISNLNTTFEGGSLSNEFESDNIKWEGPPYVPSGVGLNVLLFIAKKELV